MDCASKLVMWILALFNLVILAVGGLFCYIGIRLYDWNNKYQDMAELAELNLRNIGLFILVLSVVVLLIGILGFYGACCDSPCALKLYAFLILLLIVGEIVLLVTSHKAEVTSKLKNATLLAIHEINRNNQTAILLEQFQYRFSCCGWFGPDDYQMQAPGNDTHFITTDNLLPGSCCGINPVPPKGYQPVPCKANSSSMFNQSCSSALKIDELEAIFGTSIGLAIAVILAELILVFAACCLAREEQLSDAGISR